MRPSQRFHSGFSTAPSTNSSWLPAYGFVTARFDTVTYPWALGQPVLVGGSMGTNSYVLTGTEEGFYETFGTTCHGAGRAMSRAKSRRNLTFESVLNSLKEKGISIRVASPKLVMEEVGINSD